MNFMYISKGTVKIAQLSFLDEGFYQCLASNSYGTAMSTVTFLQRAVLDRGSGGAVIEEKRGLTEGQPFTLEHKPVKSVPKPMYTWGIAADVASSHISIVLDKRVQMDEEGENILWHRLLCNQRNMKLKTVFVKKRARTQLHVERGLESETVIQSIANHHFP